MALASLNTATSAFGAFHWVNDVPASLAANVVPLVVGVAAARIYAAVSNRRIWGLSDARTVRVFVAESARKVITKTQAPSEADRDAEPVTYARASTGIGELRGLAAIAPSLRSAYRQLDLTSVRTSNEGLVGDQGHDLISLGGEPPWVRRRPG